MSEREERVVSIELDNSDLQKKAPKTLKALNSLEDALRFKGVKDTAKNINNELNKINVDKLNKTINLLNYRFSTVGQVASAAITKATNSSIDKVYNNTIGRIKQLQSFVKSSVVTGGINRAMNLENANFQLQGILKDEEKVAAVMQNVSDSVDGTAYSLDAAAKAASQFAATGMTAGDEMFRSLRSIAGVAAMTNSEFDSISQIYTTIAGNGRLMGDQLLQLSSRGINAAATLAQQLHITEAEVRKMVSNGQISFKTFALAMDNAFGKHAKNANKTFTGALSNIKAALARIGADFVSPLIVQEGPLVKLFNNIRARINELRKFISPLANYVVNGIIDIINWLNELVANQEDFTKTLVIAGEIAGGLKNIFEANIKVLKIMRDAFLEVFPPEAFQTIYTIAVLFKTFTDNLEIGAKNAMNLKDVFVGIFSLFDIYGFFVSKGIGLAFMVLGKVIDACGGDMLELLAIVGRMIKAFDDWLWNNKYITAATDFLAKKIVSAILIIKEFKNAVVDSGVAKYLSTNLKNLSTDILKTVVDILKRIIITFNDFVKKLASGEVSSPTFILDSVINLFSDLSDIFTEGALDVLDSSNRAVQIVATAFKILSDYIYKNASPALQAIVDGIVKIAIWLFDAAKNLKLGVAEISAAITGAGIYMIGTHLETLTTLFQSIIASFTAVPKALAKMFNNIAGVFEEARKIIKGQGLTMVAAAIRSFAISIVIIAGAIALIAYTYHKDAKAFAAGITSVITIMLLITGISYTLSKLDYASIAKTSIIILSLASSIGIIAIALSQMSKMNFKALIVSVLSLAAICSILVGASMLIKLAPNTEIAFLDMISLAGSLLILSFALEKLQNVKHPIRAIIAMGECMGALLAISVLATLFKNTSKNMMGVLIMAGSLLALCFELEYIASMNLLAIWKGLLTVLPILLVLVSIQLVEALINKLGETSVKFGINAVLIAGALVTFGIAMQWIAKIGSETVKKALPVLVTFAGVVSFLTFFSKFAGENAHKAGVMMLLIAGSLIAIGAAAIVLGAIDTKQLIKGVSAVSAMMLVIGATIKLASSGQNAKTTIAGLTAIIGELIIGVALFSLIPTQDLIKAVVGLDSVMLSLGALMQLVERISIKTLMSTIGILAALTAVVLAISYIPNANHSIENMVSISIMLTTIAGVAGGLSKIEKMDNAVYKIIPIIAALTAVVAGLAYIFHQLDGLDGTNMMKQAVALSIMTVVIGGIAALLSIISEVGKQAYMAVGVFALLTACVGGIAYILYQLNDIDANKAIKNAIALGILTVVIGAMSSVLTAVSILGEASYMALIPLAGLTACVAGLAYILYQMNENIEAKDIPKLYQFVIILSAFMGVFTILTSVLTAVSLLGAQAYMVIPIMGVLAVVLGEMAVVLTLMTKFVDDGDKLIKVAEALSIAMVAFGIAGALLTVVSSAGILSITALPMIAALGVAVIELGIVLSVMTYLIDDGEKAIKVAQALAIAMVAFGVLGLLMGVVGRVAGIAGMLAGAVGLLAIVGVVAVIGLTFAAMNEAFKMLGTDLAKKIEDAIPIVENLGKLIGSFFGAIAGGVLSGTRDGLLEFADTLVEFSKKFENIDPNAANVARDICLALLEIVAGEALAKTIGFFAGGINMASFSSGLEEMGKGITSFANKTAKVKNWEGVKAGAEALKIIAEAAKTIPNEGGALAKLVGDNTLGAFGLMINDAAPALVNAEIAFRRLGDGKTINLKGLKAFASGITEVAQAADEVPNSGLSLKSLIFGDNSLKKFAEQVKEAAPELTAAAEASSGVYLGYWENLIAMAHGLGAFAQAASNIDNEGGLFSFYTGDNNLVDFAEDLSEASEPLANFAKMTGSVKNWSGGEAAAAVIETLAEAAKHIGNEGGALGVLVGDNNLGSFFDQIGGTKGVSLANFANYTAGVSDWSGIPKACQAIEQVAEVGANIKRNGGVIGAVFGDRSLGNLASGLSNFASALNDFATNVNGATLKTFEQLTNGLKLAIDAVVGTDLESAYKALDSYGTSITDKGDEIFTQFRDNIKGSETEVSEAAKETVENIANSMNSQKFKMVEVGKYMIQGLVEGLKTNSSEAEEAAVEVAQSVDEAIRSKKGFDIHSPGLKAAYDAFMVIKGLVKGFDLNKYLPVKSIDKVVKEMNDALSNGMKDLTKGIKPIDVSQFLVDGKSSNVKIPKIKQVKGLKAETVKGLNEVNTETKKTKSSFEELRDTIKDTLKSATRLFEEFAEQENKSASQVIKNLKSQITGLTDWYEKIMILNSRGLNKNLYKYLIDQGPSALGDINALITASDKEFEQINKLWADKLSINSKAANDIAGSYYETGKKSAKAYTKGVTDGQKEAEGKQKTGLLDNSLDSMFKDTKAYERYKNKVLEVLGFNMKDAVNAAAKSMEYGAASLKVFAQQFMGNTKNFTKGTAAIQKAQEAIRSFAIGLYQSSDEYKENKEKLDELTTSYNKNNKIVSDNRQDIKTYKSKKWIYKEANKIREDELKKQKEYNKKIKKLNKSNKLSDKQRAAYLKQSVAESKKRYKDADKIAKQRSETNVKRIKKANKVVLKEMDATKKQIDEINEKITTGTADAYMEYISKVASNIESFLNPLQISLETNVDWFTKFESSATKAAKANKDLATLRKEEAELLAKIEQYRAQNTVSSRKAMEEAQDRLAEVQSKISDAENTLAEANEITTRSILDSMKSQVEGVADWQKKLDKLASKGLGQAMLDKLKEMGPSGIDYVDQFMKMTGAEIKEANSYLAKEEKMSADGLLKEMKNKSKAVVEWNNNLDKLAKAGFSDELITQLVDAGPDNAEMVKTLANMTASQQKEYMKAWDDNQKAVENASLKAVNAIAYAGAKAGKDFSDAMKLSFEDEDVESAMKANGETVGSLLKQGLNTKELSKTVLKDISKGIGKYLNDTYGKDFKSKGNKIGKSINNGLKSSVNETSGKSIGKNLITGLAKGLSDKSANKAAKNLANGIIKTVKEELDIHSPSGEFESIGIYSILGLVKGWVKKAGTAESAAKETVMSMADILYNAFNEDVDINPTITPIIDTSLIQNGSKNIQDLISKTAEFGSNLDIGQYASNTYSRNAMSRFESQTSNDLSKIIKLLAKDKPSDTIVNNEINVTTGDTRKMAEDISSIINRQIERRKLVWA